MPSTATRLPLRPLVLIALVALLGTLTGCAFGEFRPSDPFDRQLTLDQAQHRYTVLVRFSDFERASAFVDAEHREDFTRRMKALDDARFTDYESETVELDDEKEKATVKVTYTIYTPALPYEIEVAETQEWSRSGITNNWKVVSSFEGLQQIVAN